MLNSRAITIIMLIAIPVALFSMCSVDSDSIRTITIFTSGCLILFTWHAASKQALSRFDQLLLRIYLSGLILFSIWLGLNTIVRDTYESSLTGNGNGAARHLCLNVEPFLVYTGLALAGVFAILCLARIFIAFRDHLRHKRSLTASNV